MLGLIEIAPRCKGPGPGRAVKSGNSLTARLTFADEPRVRIPVQDGDKVEEIKEGGRVVMLKVTPPSGNPYFLIDTGGNGIWSRRDSLDSGTRVPNDASHAPGS